MVGCLFVGYTANRCCIIAIRRKSGIKVTMVDNPVQSCLNFASNCAFGCHLSSNEWNAAE